MVTERPEPPSEPDDPDGPPLYRPYNQQIAIVLLMIFGGAGLLALATYGLQWLLKQ
jgi:hypothetical protein